MQIKVLASPEELSYDPLVRPTSLKSPTCIERDVQRHTRAMLDRRPVEQWLHQTNARARGAAPPLASAVG